jgi:hypothetical protein
MTARLDKIKFSGNTRLIIRTLPELVSKLVGQNRKNIEQLKEKYRLKKIDVLANLDHGEFSFEFKKD